MGLTDEQRLERQAYIGGSDAPALAGVNPPRWAQPIDVYLDKVGQAPPRKQSGLMALGSLMEDLVFGLAAEATGITWRRANRPVRSRQFPWAGGHLDRYGTDPAGVPVVGEGKWTMRADGWGASWRLNDEGTAYEPPDTTVVPIHYAVQVQHYLAVTGRPAGVLAVLLGYADFRWYVLPRNEAMIAGLMEIEERFWQDHVLAGVPPPPDGSDGYGRHLRDRFGSDDGAEVVATPEQAAVAAQLQAAQAGLGAYQRMYDQFAQVLQTSMGTAARLVGDGWAISWRQNKPTLKVRWEEFVTALLREQAELLIKDGMPAEWPATKKAVAEHVRKVATAYGVASEEPGARPFKPEFDDVAEDPA